MNPEKILELAIVFSGLIGTWAVMKYKLDSHSRQIDKLWDWKDKHEEEVGKERLNIHQSIAKLEGTVEATNNLVGHWGEQLHAIAENIRAMQQDLADLKADKRAREKI